MNDDFFMNDTLDNFTFNQTEDFFTKPKLLKNESNIKICKTLSPRKESKLVQDTKSETKDSNRELSFDVSQFLKDSTFSTITIESNEKVLSGKSTTVETREIIANIASTEIINVTAHVKNGNNSAILTEEISLDDSQFLKEASFSTSIENNDNEEKEELKTTILKEKVCNTGNGNNLNIKLKSDELIGTNLKENLTPNVDSPKRDSTKSITNNSEKCSINFTENVSNYSIKFADNIVGKNEACNAKNRKNINKQSDVSKKSDEGEHITVNNDEKESEMCQLSLWGLPESVLEKYESRKVRTMFPWQVNCLSNVKVLNDCKNLLYSAPTSAGKTLVAEILAIKTVFERKKKVIFILPFVSIVREKMYYFQDILGSSGIRVEGFMGSYNPPGGFTSVQIAICTIEKANSLINRLLEEEKLSEIGAILVDEIHLLGDPSRGYILELLLTKLKYISRKNENINIQIIGMSATLPNLNHLATWLDAELYMTSFRPIPLHEQAIVGGEVYDSNLKLVRKLTALPELGVDTDNILQLCLETIKESCSVLIFCPTKQWCENLSQQLATAFFKIGTSKMEWGELLRSQLNTNLIKELLLQLKYCPVGLDEVLRKTVSFGVAFHHAGLTMDERDIIESAFRNGALRVLVATSTLSSGVNLPARRVIIRTPNFHGKPIDTLTYRQMIGRAGRMGRDALGESYLICQKNDYKIAKELMSTQLRPIESCLEGAGKLKRAILEVIASGVASTPDDVSLFTKCTLLAVGEDSEMGNPIEEAVEFLKNNEFIRLQMQEDETEKYVATSLGKACLSSSIAPDEGLALFTELEKARQCFVLETELHLIYLVTPYNACSSWGNIDWMFYLELWEKLASNMKKVGELVGVKESYIVNATRGKIQTNTNKLYHKLLVHKRFFVALALQDLVNEVPLGQVCAKFSCNRGMLQSLQQSASSFAGMVTAFSRQLGWSSVEILISQFQDRMQFGVSRDLLDLMRLPILNGKMARTLYNAGIQTVVQLANSEVTDIENILHRVIPFETEKGREGESEHDKKQRNKFKNVWVTGKEGLTEREAADMLVKNAREHLKLEMGLREAKWETDQFEVQKNNEVKEILNKTPSPIKLNEEDAKMEDEGNVVDNLLDKSAMIESYYSEDSSIFSSEVNISNTSSIVSDQSMHAEEQKAEKSTKANNAVEENHSFIKSDTFSVINSTRKQKTAEVSSENIVHFPIEDIQKTKENVAKNSTFYINKSVDVQKGNSSNSVLDSNAAKDQVTAKVSSENIVQFPKENVQKTKEIVANNSTFYINKNVEVQKSNSSNSFLDSNAGKDQVTNGVVKENLGFLKSDNFPVINLTSKEKTAKTNSENILHISKKGIQETKEVVNIVSASKTSIDLDSGINTKELNFSNSSSFSDINFSSLEEQARISASNSDNSFKIPQKNVLKTEVSKLLMSPSQAELSISDSSTFSQHSNVNVSIDRMKSDESLFDESFSLHLSSSDKESVKKNCETEKRENGLDTSDDILTSSLNEEEKPNASRKRKTSKFKDSLTTPKKKKKIAQREVSLKGIEVGEHVQTSIDFSRFAITEVCQFSVLQDLYNKQLKSQNIISVSLGCKKVVEKRSVIGSNIIQQNAIVEESDQTKFTFKGRQLDGFAITFDGSTVFYVSLEKVDNATKTIKMLKTLLATENLQLRLFDSKEQIKILNYCTGVKVKSKIEDPKVADWILDPEGRQKNVQKMADKYCPEAVALTQLIDDFRGSGSIALNVYNPADPKIRSSVEAAVTYHLVDILKPLLGKTNPKYLNIFDLEMETISCLAKMEVAGISVNEGSLQALANTLKNEMLVIENKAFSLAGRRFNFMSSTDVAKVIGMFKGRKVSTRKQVLEHNEHPISDLVLQWRKINCTLTKMIYPLIRATEGQRIRGCCVTHTSTGRITMHEPNLQTVAKDFDVVNPLTKESVKISCRDAFCVPEGFSLVSADYCQLELRILAHLSQDRLLCGIMRKPGDVFKSIAAKWNKEEEDKVDYSMRQNTKHLCYGIIYGMGSKTLAEQLQMSEDEAVVFMDTFKNTYPGIKKFVKETIENCRVNGYVETISGRRRYLPHITDTSTTTRGHAERQAVNTTVQGSAADIAKKAMVDIDRELQAMFSRTKNKPKLVLHLHDELMYEVPTKYVRKVARIVKRNMENSVRLSIPFPVKLKSGKSWGQMTEYTL